MALVLTVAGTAIAIAVRMRSSIPTWVQAEFEARPSIAEGDARDPERTFGRHLLSSISSNVRPGAVRILPMRPRLILPVSQMDRYVRPRPNLTYASM